VLDVLAIALVVGTFVCLVVNIITKVAHYRQLLDFLSLVAATLFL
jgi:hypothetical protein